MSGFRLRHVNNSVCVEHRLERLSSSALSGSRANNSVKVVLLDFMFLLVLKRLRISDLEIDKSLSTLWWSSRNFFLFLQVFAEQGLPVLFSRFYDFVKGGFYRCINNVVSYVRVVAPDAPFERITEASVMAEFSRH